MNNPQLLIDTIVQQTMVFIAQLATAGGIRAPLAGVADQVFAELTEELSRQGLKKKVIADMFGMALRTYHRKTQELRLSRTEEGRTLWEVVYAYLRESGRVTAADVQTRFRHDDPEVVTGILNDLVGSGLVYRTGRGNTAVYKIADQEDFDSADKSRFEANEHLVWLYVYRNGPVDGPRIAEATRIDVEDVERALVALLASGRVRQADASESQDFLSDKFDVPLGSSQGWEAAVLDHFQAMVRAITRKLHQGPSPAAAVELIGGSTWSLDVWPGHPLEQRAKTTLSRVREEVEDLRRSIDEHNSSADLPAQFERVIVYLGQSVEVDDAGTSPVPGRKNSKS